MCSENVRSMELRLLELGLEGMGRIGKAGEVGRAFRDVKGLETSLNMASSWDTGIGPMRTRQASPQGVVGKRHMKRSHTGKSSETLAEVHNTLTVCLVRAGLSTY